MYFKSGILFKQLNISRTQITLPYRNRRSGMVVIWALVQIHFGSVQSTVYLPIHMQCK